jgi:UDP-N-acetylglucosamine 2-epimerase (non-hydrolysing)/GDP/UDP-N,N'-diacetylbacillosamine 2-epimerase (hydrolysing)
MTARRICFVTGSRADYGLLYHPMRAVAAEPGFELQVAVTGMHLSPQFGLTVGAIEADGFPITGRVESLLASDTGSGIAKSMALGTAGFADLLARAQPDLLVLLGDRYEMLAAANAALVMGVPMAHLCGGDVTEGAYDDSIRHALTKMAHLHFVTNAEAAARVIQLGEPPKRVHNVGSSGLDFVRNFERLDRATLAGQLGVEAARPWLLVTFHPVTRDARPSGEQLQALLGALEPRLADHSVIITQPNADNEGLTLTRQIEAWITGRAHAHLFASLGQTRYLSVMAEAAAVIGNSSSGLYEAPSFAVPTVNIGTRQQGRPRAASVIDCAPEREAISAAIAQARAMDCTGVTNPYGNGHTSERIVAVLKQVADFRALLAKPFHDLERSA